MTRSTHRHMRRHIKTQETMRLYGFNLLHTLHHEKHKAPYLLWVSTPIIECIQSPRSDTLVPFEAVPLVGKVIGQEENRKIWITGKELR